MEKNQKTSTQQLIGLWLALLLGALLLNQLAPQSAEEFRLVWLLPGLGIALFRRHAILTLSLVGLVMLLYGWWETASWMLGFASAAITILEIALGGLGLRAWEQPEHKYTLLWGLPLTLVGAPLLGGFGQLLIFHVQAEQPIHWLLLPTPVLSNAVGILLFTPGWTRAPFNPAFRLPLGYHGRYIALAGLAIGGIAFLVLAGMLSQRSLILLAIPLMAITAMLLGWLGSSLSLGLAIIAQYQHLDYRWSPLEASFLQEHILELFYLGLCAFGFGWLAEKASSCMKGFHRIQEQNLLLQEASKMGSWQLEGTSLALDPQAAFLCGLSNPPTTLKDWLERMPPPDATLFQNELQKAAQTGKLVQFEFHMIGDTLRTLLCQIRSHHSPFHGLQTFVGSLQSPMQQQQALSKHNTFGLALHSAKVGVVITDQNGLILYWNQSFASLYGPHCHRLELQPVDFIFAENLEVQSLFQAIYGSGEWVGELPFGKYNSMFITSSTWFDENNQPSGNILTFYDYASIFMEKQKLNTIHQRHHEELPTKSEFLANISHELRSPMNAIIGFAKLLEEEITQDHLKNYTRSIRSSSQQLLFLINDLIDLSKLDSGRLKLQQDALQLNEFLNSLKEFLQPQIQAKNLKLVVSIAPTTPQLLWMDQTRLRQILLHLFSNAIKFTETGQITLTISAFDKGIPNHVCMKFKVTDTGIGIAPEEIKNIFNLFYQGESHQTKSFAGTGLGLTLCAKLTQLLGGELSVQSKLGQGSEFTLTIDQVKVLSQLTSESLLRSTSTVLKFLPSHILVADDLELNRNLIRQYLSSTPLILHEAENGKKVLEAMDQITPDLILMDLKMPFISGFQAAQEIRKRPNIAHIPILAMTAGEMDEDFSTQTSPFTDYLQKPIHKEFLIQKLAQHLSLQTPPDSIGKIIEINPQPLPSTVIPFAELLSEILILIEKPIFRQVKTFGESLLQYEATFAKQGALLIQAAEAYDPNQVDAHLEATYQLIQSYYHNEIKNT